MTLYLRTTKDEYELPLAVAESAEELAREIGTSVNCVRSALSKKSKGWAKIEVEEDPEDERW